VAQPPLPLQVFLPLQPWSPVEHPPLPLQLFLPLQACFSTLVSSAVYMRPAWGAETRVEPLEAALAATEVPPIRPERAAVRSIALN